MKFNYNYMKNNYLKGIADYLNNKFGSDYTMTEPHPEWISQEDEQMLDIDFDSWCEAMDDWYERTHNANEDEERNIIKELVLYPHSIPDNEKQLNLIGYWR